MRTLDAPVYEINKESDWYKKANKRRSDTKSFFNHIKEKYDLGEGFSFYHSEYFGIYEGTKEFELYKDDLRKNATEKYGYHPFKKRSKYFNEIKQLIEQIEEISPFKSHDVFGLNNISGSQWIGDRWFFGIKQIKEIESDEVTPIDYKDYLQIVMDHIGDK